jgi:hypothetical protein
MVKDAYWQLIWHGAIILLVANMSGWILALAPLRNPRMMLATHVAALFGALLMIVIGMLGMQLNMTSKIRAALVWFLIGSQYLFILTGIYAAVTGTSSMFASPGGLRGTAVQEMIATLGNGAAVVGSTVASVLLLWGLRTGRRSAPYSAVSGND